MHLVGSHGLLYVQVLQVLSKLIFSCDGRDFIPPVSALRFRDLQDVGRYIKFPPESRYHCLFALIPTRAN